jgi:pimeloyl-ACP methyl ester carboxylesterase
MTRLALLLVVLLAGCAARQGERHDPMASVPCRTRAEAAVTKAYESWRTLGHRRPQPASDKAALASYAAATGELIKALSAEAPTTSWRGDLRLQTPTGPIVLRLDPGDGQATRSAGRYEKLTPIEKPMRNAVTPDATRDGLGMPLLAKVRPEVRKGVRAPGCPAGGQFTPLTAFLDFQPVRSDTVATLHLADPREVAAVAIGSREFPLARDLATTVHARLGGENFLRVAIRGLLRPEQLLQTRGVYLTGSYSREKTPILLVHGLNSDPHIWENLATAILSDPVLGTKCQIWYFIYPTGIAVPSSAAAFRDSLAEVRKFYDPEGDDPAQKKVILVGHSMGGILSHMLTVDSGDDFYRAYFRRPLDQLNMSKGTRAEAQRLLFFKSTPGVACDIFICTPHHGSPFAQNVLGRLASWLVRLPDKAVSYVVNIAKLNMDSLNPALWKFRHLGATSIDTLSPNHPYFAALAARPIRVPFYSIVGDRGRGDTPKSSDGIVTYASAHLNGAKSEAIVPYAHSCAGSPETVAQVMRVLRATVK